MPVQIELSYLIKKNQEEDLFDSYLPLRIPIAGSIRFMTQDVINAHADTAFLGIRVQQSLTKKILHFVRLAHAGGLLFPDETQPNLQFKKISMRTLSELTDSQGQQVDYSISYDIGKSRCQVVPGGVLPQFQWLALLTRDDGGFRLLHFKPNPADPGGGGDPCVLAGCSNPNRSIITAIACICQGCG